MEYMDHSRKHYKLNFILHTVYEYRSNYNNYYMLHNCIRIMDIDLTKRAQIHKYVFFHQPSAKSAPQVYVGVTTENEIIT